MLIKIAFFSLSLMALLVGMLSFYSPLKLSVYMFKLGVWLNFLDREAYTRGIEELFNTNLKDDPYTGFRQYYSENPAADFLYRIIGLGLMLVSSFLIYKFFIALQNDLRSVAMNAMSIIMGGCFIWIIGYGFNVFLPLEPEMRLVYLPSWIIPFLGKPRTRDLPTGVQFSTHLGYELSGIFMVIWGIGIYAFPLDPWLFTIIGVLSGFILGRSISKWLYQKFPYTWKSEGADK